MSRVHRRPRRADPVALSEGSTGVRSESALLGFVRDQLSALGDLLIKPMFGGAGLYLEDQFFGIFFKERLYFRVSSNSVAAYKARRMKPFEPFAGRSTSLKYYEVPVDVLESAEDLVQWARAAAEAARSTPAKRPRKRGSGRRT